MLDGRGGIRTDVMVTVSGGRITAVAAPRPAPPPTTSTGLTLLPGFIDTHVHIGWHFDANGRYQRGPEPADQAALYGAENAYVTLMAGFTTVQSVGAASDKPLRDALARGVIPGPRLLSSLGQIVEPQADARRDPRPRSASRRPTAPTSSRSSPRPASATAACRRCRRSSSTRRAAKRGRRACARWSTPTRPKR